MAYSPDGEKVLTGSQNGTARLWDATTGKPITAPLQRLVLYSQSPMALMAKLFSREAPTTRPGYGMRQQENRSAAPLLHHDDVCTVAYSPDGKTALTGSWDQTVQLWDAATGKPIGPSLQQQGRVHEVLCGPDGETIVQAWTRRRDCGSSCHHARESRPDQSFDRARHRPENR